MTYTEAMREYYSGQRYVALAGACMALIYLLVARLVYARRSQPGKSFAITIFFLAGLFMLPVNVGYFFYIGPQTAHVSSAMAQGNTQFKDLETAHLEKMMEGFHRSYRFDATVALLGLLAAAVGSVTKSRSAIGFGLALALCASTLLAGEVWSKHRALRYGAALGLVHDRSPSSSKPQSSSHLQNAGL